MLAEVSVWLCWVSVGQLRHGWWIVHCEAFVHRWPPPLPRPLLYIFFSIIFLSPKLDGLLFHFNECLFDQVCKQASKICHLSSDQPSLDNISAVHKHTCIDCWDGWCAHIRSHTGFSVQANKKNTNLSAFVLFSVYWRIANQMHCLQHRFTSEIWV